MLLLLLMTIIVVVVVVLLTTPRGCVIRVGRMDRDADLAARLARLRGVPKKCEAKHEEQSRPTKPEEQAASMQLEREAEAEALLEELTSEEWAASLPSPPPSFPAAPTHSVADSPMATKVTAAKEGCHVCGGPAYVWCVGCENSPFCSTCWREVHVGVAGGGRADASLRLHTTVPCRASRPASAMPSVPCAENAAPSSTVIRAPSKAPVLLKAPVLKCQTCSSGAYVCCLDCDRSNYCLKCWREIHVFPRSDLMRHRREPIPLSARSG